MWSVFLAQMHFGTIQRDLVAPIYLFDLFDENQFNLFDIVYVTIFMIMLLNDIVLKSVIS